MGAIFLAMTIGGLLIAAILLAISFRVKRSRLRTFVLGGVTTWLSGYVILLFIGSFFSVEKTLALNEPKQFCGFYLDCHLSAKVTGIRKAKTFGALTAKNEFYIVKINVSNAAKIATLALITPKFTVLDAQGRNFEPTEDSTVTVKTSRFEEKIPAGGAFEDEIAFDLPTDAQNPRLDIREGYGIDHAIEAILIGDEDSIGHKRNYFKLETEMQTAKF